MSKELEPLPDDAWRKPPARKDRRRWCGGHEGREHTPEVIPNKNLSTFGSCGPRQGDEGRTVWRCIHLVACATCGRVLEHGDSTPCPIKPEGMDYAWPKERLAS